MNKIYLVNIDLLKSHEIISKKRVGKIIKDILLRKMIINPVVVDQETMVILDGHHRRAALQSLKIKKIPVYFVNYFSSQVQVKLRRKKLLMDCIKKSVIYASLSNALFPIKTTKHNIKNLPKNININIKSLSI